VLSHFGGEYEREADGTVKGADFYLPFIRAMLEIGYEGYIGYELCHPLPVVGGQTVGIDFADKNARLAAEYMRGVIAEAETSRTLKDASFYACGYLLVEEALALA